MAQNQQDWLNYYYSHGGTGAGLNSSDMAAMRKAYEASKAPAPTAGTRPVLPGLPGYNQPSPSPSPQLGATLPTGQSVSITPTYYTPGMLSAANANISANLGGQIPKEDVDFLKTQAAERAVGQGMPAGAYGSTMPNFDLLRTLGLTQMQRRDTGVEQQQRQQAADITSYGQLLNWLSSRDRTAMLADRNSPAGGQYRAPASQPSPVAPQSPIAPVYQPTPTPTPQYGWGQAQTAPQPSIPNPGWMSSTLGTSPLSTWNYGADVPTAPVTTPFDPSTPAWQAPSMWESGAASVPEPTSLSPWGYNQDDWFPMSFEEEFFDYLDQYGG